MVFQKNDKTAPLQGVKFKKSMLAMCIVALSAPSIAQQSENVEEVVVSGVRTSLQNAQDIKRESDTFVDAISSSDIGALPDRSVLEAMQRIPGVSIERFAGVNDPDHFGVEGSGAVIRGMTATRSEFNGRDSFTANSGRGLSFQDVPPELMAGVDVYKNQSADMIEGGIGGTVSLRTRKPFDSNDRVLAFSADMTYGDMVEEWTPTISALYSDRWETSSGEFGFLLNIADSHLEASSHGIQTDRYESRLASTFEGAEEFVGADGQGRVWAPTGSNATMKIDERDRNGYATAIQWENPEDTVLATFQYMRSDATLTWKENALKFQGDYNAARTFPLEGTAWEFDNEGVFDGGVIADRKQDWRGDGNRIPHNASWSSPAVPDFGLAFQTDTRYKSTNTVVDDFAFNVKFTPSDEWEFIVDAQYIEAETKDDDVDLFFGTFAMQDYRGISGETPDLSLIDPWQWAINNGVSSPWAGNPEYFQSETSYFWRSAMDHYERSEGDSVALRFDSTYFMEDGFFKAVKFGARFSEREQNVRYSAYNWGQLAAPYGPPIYARDANGEIIFDGGNPQTIYDAGAAWLDSPRAVDAGLTGYDVIDWGNFYRGGTLSIPGGNQLFHPQLSLTKDYANWGTLLAPVNNDWDPANARDVNKDGIIDNVAGSLFMPWELNTVNEENKAAYIRVDFGSDDYALRFNGNVGLRYVKIDRDITGFTAFPNLNTEYKLPAWFDASERARYASLGINYTVPAQYANEDPRFLGQYLNFITDEEKAFSNGHFRSNDASPSEDHVLPSFNLKVGFTDDLVGRFAVSKAIALPDIGDLRSQTRLSQFEPQSADGLTFGGQDSKPGELRLIDLNKIEPIRWQASAGNPYLKAMESVQWDASLEWYFADVGSLTTSIFYKDLSNFFVKDIQIVNYTNESSGITAPVVQEQTRNTGEGSMEGFEIAYQQFYDMLPAPFDGLGTQLNYSYIKASGVPSYDSANNAYDVEALPLQGQSKETYNATLMYEKYDWSVRFAYNWRSKYLLTTRDVITGLPIYNDDAGFLDASVFYNINESFKVGVQFTNLLDTQTKTYMQVDAEGTQLGRSWFINDRRATIVVRGTF